MKPDERKLLHPRPDMYREGWTDLNGSWEFCFDDADEGLAQGWYEGHGFDKTIQVPFCYQSEKSGIGDATRHEILWYAKTVNLPPEAGGRIWLNFGAVDYEATVWVNGCFATRHEGGYDPFAVDISPFVKPGEGQMRVVLRVRDSYATWQPRGKQHWGEVPDRCWYVATSGIWQAVWLEYTPGDRIAGVQISPDIEAQRAECALQFSAPQKPGAVLGWELLYGGETLGRGRASVQGDMASLVIPVGYNDPIDNHLRLWSAETPDLYDLRLTLHDGANTADEVETCFGMRKIERRGCRILLNHRPLYQRLVLNQGYWADSLLTPPGPQALLEDLQQIKAMGFNGVRMHQKAEDPRFYYLADCLGLYVWNEMPSAYQFCPAEVGAITAQWQSIILRDYNHPSIIAWVPLNESWGVRDILHSRRQQHFAQSLYHLTHALDATRLVGTNDGWEQVESDLVGVHDYEGDGEALAQKYADWGALKDWQVANKMLFAGNKAYEGEPVIFSEFGGVAIEDGAQDSWGYNGKVKNPAQWKQRIAGIMAAVRGVEYFAGFCYTQFADVQQETNGLVREDRTPKIPLEELRGLFAGEA